MTDELETEDVARAMDELARARVRLARSVVALREEATRRTDWREWIRRRPQTSLALAFAFGVFLARRH